METRKCSIQTVYTVFTYLNLSLIRTGSGPKLFRSVRVHCTMHNMETMYLLLCRVYLKQSTAIPMPEVCLPWHASLL